MFRSGMPFRSMLLPCLAALEVFSGTILPPRAQAADDPGRSAQTAKQQEIPDALRDLFIQLDSLGREKVKDARFVELHLSATGERSRRQTEKAWLILEGDKTVTVLKDDLLPWTYQKKSPTRVPTSWQPTSVILESVTEGNFESLCRDLVKPEPEPKDDIERMRRSFNAPGPSNRLLAAHAAWKRGLSKYCEPMLAGQPGYRDDFPKYRSEVLEDLAWLHFLRGVNLLMYADRREILPHLRLVKELSPKGQYAAQAQGLAKHLERLVAEDGKKPKTSVDESRLSDVEKAKRYISELRDLRSPQTSQPGDITPYWGIVEGGASLIPPTVKLRAMGIKAAPALIEALDDDTPTRTVYHWRDFHRSRVVWRVSDFAWAILRDTTKKELGYRPVVGFTVSSMKPEEKRLVIEGIKKWYAATKDLSPDDRIFASFSSHEPEDWLKAGRYFLDKKDSRAVKPLLEKLTQAGSFRKGDLCELVVKFGDPIAKKPIREVMETAKEHSDRLSAAIALWTLGDSAGTPVAVKYVKAEEQPYGGWDTPVWFLMRTRTKEAMAALKSLVTEAPAKRAGEILDYITASITGDLWGERREPAGCVEICLVLIAAMDRGEYTGRTVNDIKIRIKDSAAKAFVLLKEGTKGRFGGRFVNVDLKVFNELEPDEAKRDVQIRGLKDWYERNKSRLTWDSKERKLVVK